MSDLPPPGWYPDTNSPAQNRYWDGVKWTEHTAPTGAASPPTFSSPTDGSSAPSRLGRWTSPQRLSAIAILVVALSAFLPWVSIFGISKLGIEGDGIITLVIAIGGALLLALSTGLIGSPKSPGKASQITLLVLAALVALIGLVDMNGAAAIGLYLTFFGGLAWVVGAAWQLGLRGGPTTPTGG